MVENWEIEWNDSMLRHGQDMGTVEFLVAKGGNLSDINYVLYGVQDDSWEPIIKAVATRDNSHPDIIRKQAPQFSENFSNQELGQRGFGRNFARNLQAIGAGQRLMQAQAANQPGQALDYARTGQYGSALAAGARNLFGGGGQTGQPGMLRRVGQTMRELPRAYMQNRRAKADARDSEARRRRLEGGLASAEGETDSARSRYVPGSQGFDENMQRQQGALNQRLTRDFNMNIPTDDSGQPTMTAQEAMRDEIKQIGEAATKKRPGTLERARQMAEQRRAQKRGDAFRPDQVAGAGPEEVAPEATMAEGSPEAEQAAMADANPEEPRRELVFGGQPVEAAPPATQAGPPTPSPAPAPAEPEAPVETATATEAAPAGDDDARMQRIRDYLTQTEGREKGQFYGAKTIGEKGSQAELPQRMMDAGFDPADTAMKITQEMIDAMGFSSRSKQGRYFTQQLQADPRFQQAVAAGDEEKAKDIAEDTAKKTLTFGGGTETPAPTETMSEGGAFELSSDKHEASWDALLKGLNIR